MTPCPRLTSFPAGAGPDGLRATYPVVVRT